MADNDTKYLALLRGINVGGNNIIAKDDLKACFEDMGFTSVRTYIQSGNILFRSEGNDTKALTEIIERGLSKRFGYDARAVVLSFAQYGEALASSPSNWGMSEDYRHNALFTLSGITPKDFVAALPPPREGIESVAAGEHAVFWSASKAQAGKASYAKLPGMPLYKQVTIRNQNTVFKILKLFDEI